MGRRCVWTVGEGAPVFVSALVLAASGLAVSACGLDTEGVFPSDGGSSPSDSGHTLAMPDAADARTSTDGPLSQHDARPADASTHDAFGVDAHASDGTGPPPPDASSDTGAHDGGEHDAFHDAFHDTALDQGATEMQDAGTDSGPSCTAGTPCGIGGTCTTSSECMSNYCDTGQCAYAASCNALLQADSALRTGPYMISAGGSTFAVYCDMTAEGGGWTLVAKMGSNASPGTFDYNADYWTTNNTLATGSTDTTQTEAKFQSFNVVPFTNVLAAMTPLGGGAINALLIPLADTTSFLHMMNDTTPPTTSLGRAAWLALSVPAANVQAHCNAEGVNQQPSGGGAQGNTAHIRLGLLGNDGNDCASPDSYVGFGGEYGASCAGGASLSAGSMGGGIICSGGSNVTDFGYLFVR